MLRNVELEGEFPCPQNDVLLVYTGDFTCSAKERSTYVPSPLHLHALHLKQGERNFGCISSLCSRTTLPHLCLGLPHTSVIDERFLHFASHWEMGFVSAPLPFNQVRHCDYSIKKIWPIQVSETSSFHFWSLGMLAMEETLCPGIGLAILRLSWLGEIQDTQKDLGREDDMWRGWNVKNTR